MIKTQASIFTSGIIMLLASTSAFADAILDKWKQGLSGARLTAYKGSAISSNSSLTVLNLCRNGRYSYYREGSWSVPGTAGGASSNRVTGRWDVQRKGNQVLLVYVTDQGQEGAFPMYLQNNGRVNIGGLAYAVQAGGAGC